MTNKPHIHYSDMGGPCIVGRSTYIFVCEHPRCGAGWVWTSAVLGIIEQQPNGPVFETQNSIYLPVATDESNPYAKRAVPMPVPAQRIGHITPDRLEWLNDE